MTRSGAARVIMLARHGTHGEVGRVLSGRSEVALSAAGEREAAALADWLERRPPASIHASPRRRTQQTAAAVSQRLGLPVRPAPALDEIDFGTFAGRSFDALEDDPDWRHWNAARDTARCPGGETMAEAVSRALAYLAAIAAADAPALCVTHCDIIRGLVAHVLGMRFERMFALRCDPGSLTMLVLDGADAGVHALNVTPGSAARAAS